MQLRIARLCLDCEELHVEDRCPVCASEQYAFLSAWLPSEERRRWRRPATKAAELARRPIRKLVGVLARWVGLPIDDSLDGFRGPHTRASDRMPDLNFNGRAPAPKSAHAPTAAAEPLTHAQKR
jgi:hypothetical protein